MKKLKLISETRQEYYNAMYAYRRCLHDVFQRRLDEGQYVDFNKDDLPEITYDGGNHPEYASTLCSTCFGVGKKNGRIYFNLQDSNEYDIDRMFVDDLDVVAGHLARALGFFW